VWEGVREGEERDQREGGSFGGMGLGGGSLLTLMNEIKLTLLVYAVYLVFW